MIKKIISLVIFLVLANPDSGVGASVWPVLVLALSMTFSILSLTAGITAVVEGDGLVVRA